MGFAPTEGYFSRWATFAACLLLSSVSGTGYAFGLFSTKMKEFGYSQFDVTLVGTVGNFGLYTSVIGGLFYDRFGPRRTVLVAGVLAGSGFMLLSLAFNEVIDHPVWLVAFFFFIAQHGSAWLTTASVSTAQANFPRKFCGQAVGLTKGLSALSSALLAEYYVGLFAPHHVGRLLMFLAAYVPAVVVLCIAPLSLLPKALRRTCEYDRKPNPTFLPWFALCGTFAVILATGGILQRHHREDELRIATLLATCLLLVCFIVLPLLYGPPYVRAQEGYDTKPLHDDVNKAPIPLSVSSGLLGQPPRHLGDNHTLSQTLRTLEFYVLGAVFMVAAGSGLLFINNIAQIAEAFVGPGHEFTDLKTLLVTVISTSNFFGRVTIGHLSDRFSAVVSRPCFLAASVAVMGVAMLLLAALPAPSETALYAAAMIVGTSYGGVFSTIAAITSDLFGRDHFAGNYGAVDFAPSLGSLLLATVLAGHVYSKHVTELHLNACYGVACFRLSFAVVSGLCLIVAVPLGLLLARRARPAYATRPASGAFPPTVALTNVQ